MSLFGCFQLDGVPAGEPCGPALVLLVLGAQAVDRGDDLNVTIPQFQDLLDRLDLISAGGLLESRPAALTVVRLVGFVRFPILRPGLAPTLPGRPAALPAPPSAPAAWPAWQRRAPAWPPPPPPRGPSAGCHRPPCEPRAARR